MRAQTTLFAFCLLLLGSASSAQTGVPAGAPGVPPVIRFSGTIAQAVGPVPMTFALYADQTGGAPLWAERQTVEVGADGRYVVVLGAATALPAAVFAGGDARWLGVQPEGDAEQPRVLLVSVPYAFMAADAETIGGKPLSSLVLAGTTTGVGADGLTYVNTQALKTGLQAAGAAGQTGEAGTANYIGVFTDATDLGNSVMYQNGTWIGLGTTSPLAPLHVAAPLAPAAFFDVFSPVLTALPVVYRAARGTPTAPSAVQTDDILGGLAVRGFGASVFSPGGRGQVMFKAAENWTDSANGTYLSMTTTPVGSTSVVERLHIGANGYVGLGTSSPLFPIDAQLGNGTTYAAFGEGGVPLFLMAGQPHVGFNVYYSGGYFYGSTAPAGYLAFNQVTTGGFTFATAPSGTANSAATMSPRLTITNAGRVGIGTTAPSQVLDVAGNVNAGGAVTAGAGPSTFTNPTANGTALQGTADSGTSAWGVYGESGAGVGVVAKSTTGTGIVAQVTSGTGVYGGSFQVLTGTTGKAIGASVNGTETMYVDATGVHAGAGLTGTPLAYGTFNANGTKAAGSANISCTAYGSSGAYYYDCTITGYSPTTHVAVVTAVTASSTNDPIFATTTTGGNNVLRIRLWDLSTVPGVQVQAIFHVVVFKP
jgi:hypothetical protein